MWLQVETRAGTLVGILQFLLLGDEFRDSPNSWRVRQVFDVDASNVGVVCRGNECVAGEDFAGGFVPLVEDFIVY